MINRNYLIFLLFLFYQINSVFSFNDSIVLNKKRLASYLISSTTIYSASFIALNRLWYSEFDRSKFHFFNDNREWLQMDKSGHFFSSYYLTGLGYELFKWAGTEKNKALFFSSLQSTIYLGTIEVFDGFSSAWGFSLGDFFSNIGGTLFFYLQEKFLNKQIVFLKFSYFPSEYAKLNPDLLGKTFVESLFKDYNAQRYWISINLSSVFTNSKFIPKFLNLSFGYGASGMIGARNNPDEFSNIPRRRNFYLSFDFDLKKLSVNNKILKKTLNIINVIKIPFPAIMYNNNNKFKYYWIFF